MKRILLLSTVVAFLAACDEGENISAPEVDGLAASLTATTCTGVAGDMYADCMALVALYNATGGENWTNNTNWGTPDHCNWYGVTCSTDALPRVIELRLLDNGLTGPVPAEIGQLTELVSLNLSVNPLVGPLPAQLFGLTGLLSLEIYSTNLGGQFPNDITRLTNLRYLNLGGNDFTGIIPAGLGNLTSLVSLTLNGNKLTGEIPATLANLTNLNGLYLAGNQLTGPLPDLSGMSQLYALGLQFNPIGGSIPTWLGSMSNLRDLSLISTGMTGPIPDELAGLTRLRHLYLGLNDLTGGIPAWLGDLSELVTLYLLDAGLTGQIPSELGKLTNLTQLFLNDNQLEGPVPDELAGLTRLTLLWAQNNNLSGSLSYVLAGLGARLGSTCLLYGNSLYVPDTDAYRNLTDPPGQSICNLPYVTVNVAPQVTSIATVTEPVSVGVSVNVLAQFTDTDLTDTHTAVIDWGDGTSTAGSVIFASGTGSLEGSHSYAVAGVYDLTVTVTDDSGDSGSLVYQYVVVYDPVGGFATGAGQIDSPAGAYTPDATLSGKAIFGFESKYAKGATVPTGNVLFRFIIAQMKFQSTSHSWLTVNENGTNAQFKGRGTINGQNDASGAEYHFMIWAHDGPDTFRIKIWSEVGATENVMYDNGVQQAISGGQIKVHQ